MSRSTFYLHYPDQFALLEDIEKEVLEKTFEYLKSLDTEANSIASIEVLLNYIKEIKPPSGFCFVKGKATIFRKALYKKCRPISNRLFPDYPML